MEAVILAGGKGTRLAEMASDLPKALVPVLGTPVLDYQIESLRRSGVTDVTIVVGHLGQQIKDHFGSGRPLGPRLRYFTEDSTLGTGGALAYLRDRVPDHLFVISADSVLDSELA